MSYQALYRVWRPQTFEDVVGQYHITKTLQNSLIEETYSHAYLFCGPRGTGKTSAAKLLAKAVNCEEAPIAEPCNQCPACLGITKGQVVDVVEIDAASNNGVDEIRDIRDKVRFAPTEVKMKVYIIDEVHMLSQGAFNALLKTLEEPPAHVMFILATTEAHKIPLTIISRCQRFDFKRISRKAMMARISYICDKEGIKLEEEALALLAQAADGGMRDALSLLDQAVSFADEVITQEDVTLVTGAVTQQTLAQLADAIIQGRLEQVIDSLNQLMDQGKEPIRLVEDLIFYYRDILLYQSAPELEGVLERVQLTDDFKAKANTYAREKIFSIIEKLSKAQNEMKWTNHPRVFLEVAFIQVIQAEVIVEKEEQDLVETNEKSSTPTVSNSSAPELAQLQERIISLERQLEQLEQAVTNQSNDGDHSSGRRRSNSNAERGALLSTALQKIKELLFTASKASLVRCQQNWSNILDELKREKITVHAWLVDGEPVACSDNFCLVAFKSIIHRETTEKDSHKQLIEKIVAKHLQSTPKLYTIMYNDWNLIKEDFIRSQKGEKDSEQAKDPFYEEAIKLVGEDLVEVVEK